MQKLCSLFSYSECYACICCTVGVEDLENYHGKALGDKGKAAVELIKSSLSSDTLNGLGPQPVVDDAPSVDLSVKLSEPPNYTIGEKVCTCR